MVIIATLYVVVVWLIFSKLKLVRWGWFSGSIAVAHWIVHSFRCSSHCSTTSPPSRRIVVTGRVVEVTPNVSGEVVAIPGTPNVSLKAGTVLFEINPKPYQYKVSELEAALVGARQQAEQLKASYEQATANVEGLTSQLHFQKKRLADIQKLSIAQALSVFKEQDPFRLRRWHLSCRQRGQLS
jgi:multidrug resistance efflux pump